MCRLALTLMAFYVAADTIYKFVQDIVCCAVVVIGLHSPFARQSSSNSNGCLRTEMWKGKMSFPFEWVGKACVY